jgi:hypothetical protein
MMPQWSTAILPVVSAFLGLLAGMFSPLITGAVTRRARRRDDQRALCDETLSMFRDINVVETLRDPRNGARRALLLNAVRIVDRRARDACTALVGYASRADAIDDEILDHWTAMITEVARVHRAIG